MRDSFMDDLFRIIMRWCRAAEKPIVLMIDEVDSAADNQVFLDFLAQLRSSYIERNTLPAFWSVILAGVTDIKNLRRKLRHGDAHKFNSPWNIAADFNIEMSFTVKDIEGMLEEYETDFHTGMDMGKIAVSDAQMYGFIRNNKGFIKIVNRIFETRLYNFFLNTEELQNKEERK